MPSKKKLGKLEPVPLSQVWEKEARDFTPWLAEGENLNQLADAIGLNELLLVGTEHSVGDFKLDVLCTDGEDKVAIENQLEESDHKHLGQISVYAAGVGAKKVIWIAQSFRPEHLSALEFLNANTTEELSFFAVKIELWRIGDSPPAPLFKVEVKPDYWVRVGREQARTASTASGTKRLQLEFWTELSKVIQSRALSTKPQRPAPQHWLNFPIGRHRFLLKATANTRDERLGAELWISGPKANQHFAELKEQQVDIEGKLGFDLDWQDLPDADGCRIATWYRDAPLENRTRWPEYIDWLIERLTTMDKVLRPYVRALG